ncbi:MAG: hypothetical protein ACFCVA_04150 [Gammaproteobacteria bacterium]
MNWPTPFGDVMQMWTTAQQKVWSTWLDTMQGIGRSPTPDLRGKIIETWEQSVRYSLDAQAEWMRAWSENLQRVESIPEDARQWLAHSQREMEQWHSAQRQLWDNLFVVLKQAEPGTTAHTLQRTSEGVFQTWQESVHKMIENQLEWVSEWSRKPTNPS